MCTAVRSKTPKEHCVSVTAYPLMSTCTGTTTKQCVSTTSTAHECSGSTNQQACVHPQSLQQQREEKGQRHFNTIHLNADASPCAQLATLSPSDTGNLPSATSLFQFLLPCNQVSIKQSEGIKKAKHSQVLSHLYGSLSP